MKKEEIDKLITESLSKDEAEFYHSLDGNEGLFEMFRGLYKGKLAWITGIMTLVHTVITVIAFYTGYLLFTTENIAEMLQYGSIMFIALIFGAMIKLWTWMQMNRNSILREIRRLEYQVAVLMEKKSAQS
jgi:D-alanyl-lipoteichoic acid acyltransferase DltB (MBOAT superfamily)